MSGVVVWSPERKFAFELIAKAKELGLGPVTAVALGDAVANPEEFGKRGADQVLTFEDPSLKNLNPETVVDAVTAAAKQTGATHVFTTATRRGKEVAPRVAVRLGWAAVSNAAGVRKGDKGLELDRPFMGGKTVATEVPAGNAVVAFSARLFEPLPENAGASAKVAKLDLKPAAAKVTITERKPRPSTGVNLEEAQVVIGAGRGVKQKDDLKLLQDLADLLGGQIGCSRPLATDLGWLSDDYWIGLSGKEIKPKLYVAAGISGQIQHTTGIRGAKVIVSINTNKDAPIFKISDYGVVGDLYKILPALTAAIKKELGK
ncbi:MAG TPA: electron transfer flavoprotein subunit alpha/FixB family protein [Candidatus Thermoplasmatota archaeon]|nr:electron transfer flavoprotein subunit alpha/FixB family protein [Candidatus Thermoplasmatota archaeon]